MFKRISASDAKNNFGGLLEDVAALDGIEIIKHGRPVAVVLSMRAFRASRTASAKEDADWGKNHMISPELARAAVMVRPPAGFDED